MKDIILLFLNIVHLGNLKKETNYQSENSIFKILTI